MQVSDDAVCIIQDFWLNFVHLLFSLLLWCIHVIIIIIIQNITDSK